MAWQPEVEPLNQLAKYLRDSLRSHDASVRKNAEQMLQQAKRSPDINNYLVYLCITSSSPSSSSIPPEEYLAARRGAAVMLKNNVKTSFKSLSSESLGYIKANIVVGLQDKQQEICNDVGNIIAEIVLQGGILGWPQVLADLVQMVQGESNQPKVQEAAMGALYKICEDNTLPLDQEYHNQRPLEFLLPKLLEFTGHESANLRSKALATINLFLSDPVSMTARANIASILQHIVQLSRDPTDEVRRFVCRSFALLADSLPEVLVPHVGGIVEYTLLCMSVHIDNERQGSSIDQQTKEKREELALDAAEFFFQASGNRKLRNALSPFLAKIVPSILDCMAYSEVDQVRLLAEANDAEVEDDEKDIRPQFATSKTQHNTVQKNGQTQSAENGYAYEEDDLSDGEIEEEGDADPEDEWNLRKCSAAALDTLALHFHGAVFEKVLPWLIQNLKHEDWPKREAAVLALGAIGPGCMEDVKPHLPDLIPYLISLLTDEIPVVRQITCWSLSRYATWAAYLEWDGKEQFFVPMMDGILKRMMDDNKKVQELAASSFAILEEAAQSELTDYCGVILQQFVQCFEKYKDKNRYVLYQCVQSLAEYVPQALSEPENVSIIMPALIGRWNNVNILSKEMVPLQECLSYIAMALGPQYAPFAGPPFLRCIQLIQYNLKTGNMEFMDQSEKDFVVTSLDLLSSIIQSLTEAQSIELVANAQPNMFELLGVCMTNDRNDDVKQSAYALLGDCAIYIFPHLQAYLPQLMEILLAQLDVSRVGELSETVFPVINNACWACGEISMRQKDMTAQFVNRMLERLGSILLNKQLPKSLNENAAIALGRLGICYHEQLAPHLSNFAGPFLQAMKSLREWTDEKGHSYRGFVNVVLDNPEALSESDIADFFVEIANAPDIIYDSMQDDGPFLGFKQVLTVYHQRMKGFDEFVGNLQPAQQQQIRRLLYSS